MVVVALDGGLGFSKADVVEAGEAGAVNVLDGVIRQEEALLPAHKDKVSRAERLVVEGITIEGFSVVAEAEEAGPVFSVNLLIRLPLARQEGILRGDDLPVEEGRHCRVLLRQPFDHQVAAEVGVRLVDVLKDDLHLVGVPLGGLEAAKLGATVEAGVRHAELTGVHQGRRIAEGGLFLLRRGGGLLQRLTSLQGRLITTVDFICSLEAL